MATLKEDKLESLQSMVDINEQVLRESKVRLLRYLFTGKDVKTNNEEWYNTYRKEDHQCQK